MGTPSAEVIIIDEDKEQGESCMQAGKNVIPSNALQSPVLQAPSSLIKQMPPRSDSFGQAKKSSHKEDQMRLGHPEQLKQPGQLGAFQPCVGGMPNTAPTLIFPCPPHQGVAALRAVSQESQRPRLISLLQSAMLSPSALVPAATSVPLPVFLSNTNLKVVVPSTAPYNSIGATFPRRVPQTQQQTPANTALQNLARTLLISNPSLPVMVTPMQQNMAIGSLIVPRPAHQQVMVLPTMSGHQALSGHQVGSSALRSKPVRAHSVNDRKGVNISGQLQLTDLPGIPAQSRKVTTKRPTPSAVDRSQDTYAVDLQCPKYTQPGAAGGPQVNGGTSSSAKVSSPTFFPSLDEKEEKPFVSLIKTESKNSTHFSTSSFSAMPAHGNPCHLNQSFSLDKTASEASFSTKLKEEQMPFALMVKIETEETLPNTQAHLSTLPASTTPRYQQRNSPHPLSPNLPFVNARQMLQAKTLAHHLSPMAKDGLKRRYESADSASSNSPRESTSSPVKKRSRQTLSPPLAASTSYNERQTNERPSEHTSVASALLQMLERNSAGPVTSATADPRPMTSFSVDPKPMMSVSAEPRPVMSVSAEPRPMTSFSVDPKLITSVSVEPRPMMSVSAASRPRTSFSVDPKTMTSFSVDPKLITSVNAEPRPMMPVSAASRPMTSLSVDPKPMTSFSVDPKLITSVSAEPRPMISVSANPKPMSSATSYPRPIMSTVVEPRPTMSVTADQRIIISANTDPVSANPYKPLSSVSADPKPLTSATSYPRPLTSTVLDPRPTTSVPAAPRLVMSANADPQNTLAASDSCFVDLPPLVPARSARHLQTPSASSKEPSVHTAPPFTGPDERVTSHDLPASATRRLVAASSDVREQTGGAAVPNVSQIKTSASDSLTPRKRLFMRRGAVWQAAQNREPKEELFAMLACSVVRTYRGLWAAGSPGQRCRQVARRPFRTLQTEAFTSQCSEAHVTLLSSGQLCSRDGDAKKRQTRPKSCKLVVRELPNACLLVNKGPSSTQKCNLAFLQDTDLKGAPVDHLQQHNLKTCSVPVQNTLGQVYFKSESIKSKKTFVTEVTSEPLNNKLSFSKDKINYKPLKVSSAMSQMKEREGSAIDLDVDQREVLEHWNDQTLLINAGPGAGKTLVLCQLVRKIFQQQENARVLVLAFNRFAVAELKARLLALGACVPVLTHDDKDRAFHSTQSCCLVSTFHSFAFQSSEKTTRFTDKTFDPEFKENARLLKRKPKSSPARVWDWVIVDESQDVNAARGAMISTLQETCRHLVVAGDPRQSLQEECNWFAELWSDRCASAFKKVLRYNHRSSPHIVKFLNLYSKHNFSSCGLHVDQMLPEQHEETESWHLDDIVEKHDSRTHGHVIAQRLMAASCPLETYAIAPVTLEKYKIGAVTDDIENTICINGGSTERIKTLAAIHLSTSAKRQKKNVRAAPFQLGTVGSLKGTERGTVVVYGVSRSYSPKVSKDLLAKRIYVALSRARKQLHVITNSKLPQHNPLQLVEQNHSILKAASGWKCKLTVSDLAKERCTLWPVKHCLFKYNGNDFVKPENMSSVTADSDETFVGEYIERVLAYCLGFRNVDQDLSRDDESVKQKYEEDLLVNPCFADVRARRSRLDGKLYVANEHLVDGLAIHRQHCQPLAKFIRGHLEGSLEYQKVLEMPVRAHRSAKQVGVLRGRVDFSADSGIVEVKHAGALTWEDYLQAVIYSAMSAYSEGKEGKEALLLNLKDGSIKTMSSMSLKQLQLLARAKLALINTCSHDLESNSDQKECHIAVACIKDDQNQVVEIAAVAFSLARVLYGTYHRVLSGVKEMGGSWDRSSRGANPFSGSSRMGQFPSSPRLSQAGLRVDDPECLREQEIESGLFRDLFHLWVKSMSRTRTFVYWGNEVCEDLGLHSVQDSSVKDLKEHFASRDPLKFTQTPSLKDCVVKHFGVNWVYEPHRAYEDAVAVAALCVDFDVAFFLTRLRRSQSK